MDHVPVAGKVVRAAHLRCLDFHLVLGPGDVGLVDRGLDRSLGLRRSRLRDGNRLQLHGVRFEDVGGLRVGDRLVNGAFPLFGIVGNHLGTRALPGVGIGAHDLSLVDLVGRGLLGLGPGEVGGLGEIRHQDLATSQNTNSFINTSSPKTTAVRAVEVMRVIAVNAIICSLVGQVTLRSS